jgi:quinol monooxygenase YgiN
MNVSDKRCFIAPYFEVPEENLEQFKALCMRFVESAKQEPKCLYYSFFFDGNQAHCREGYADADGVLAHLENVGSLLEEALTMAKITRMEIHGPEAELEKLRGPLAKLQPRFFVRECGFHH